MNPGSGGTATPGAVFAVAAGLLLLTGCVGEKAAGTPTPATSTSSAVPKISSESNPHVAFDPCTALTPQFLAQQQWNAKPPEPKQDSAGGVTWKGCRYVAKAGYGFVIETTNNTFSQVRDKFPAAVEIPAGPRKAVRYEARPDVPGGCSINIEMRAGSLYILTNVPQTPANRNLAACDIATEIAQAVAPLLPAGS
ncbi:DUF3558 domain-containing protein [Nocardia sp. CS682]|uniref:DUF3558 domain-containing protein n=1 Tax=Nocardia sp. CS682 TaxID=1047172 RepID=UPI001074AC66|nr:DUF3558 domain-containing protein [Nocardia sp. CS682]QBS41221.1 DUF3558 domain-containing protein [Nocardia sp. CS682]